MTDFWDATTHIGKAVNAKDASQSFVCVDNVIRTAMDGDANYIIAQCTPGDERLFVLNGNVLAALGGKLPLFVNNAPVSVRHSRMTLTIRNTTQTDQIEGYIRVMKADTPISWGFSGTAMELAPGTVQTITSLLSVHPQCKTYTNKQVANGLTISSRPMHRIAYKEYHRYSPVHDANTLQVSLQTGAAANAMETIIIQCTGTSQLYDVSLHCQDAATYPQHTLIGTLQREVPNLNSGGDARMEGGFA